MSERCNRCGRPQQSDREWSERVAVPGACLATGSEACDDARDERVRRLERVAEAARRMHPVRAGRCVDCGGYTYPGTGHYRDCRAELLIIALRALDGEG